MRRYLLDECSAWQLCFSLVYELWLHGFQYRTFHLIWVDLVLSLLTAMTCMWLDRLRGGTHWYCTLRAQSVVGVAHLGLRNQRTRVVLRRWWTWDNVARGYNSVRLLIGSQSQLDCRDMPVPCSLSQTRRKITIPFDSSGYSRIHFLRFWNGKGSPWRCITEQVCVFVTQV